MLNYKCKMGGFQDRPFLFAIYRFASIYNIVFFNLSFGRLYYIFS